MVKLKLSNETTIAIIGLVLVLAFIAFLSLPRDIPDARRLKTERLVKLVDQPQISFASPDDAQNNLSVDAFACTNGIIVPSAEDCPLIVFTNETINCDGTIEDPVCGQDEQTYLNSCYAEQAGVSYVPGMCNSTGGGLINVTNKTIGDIPESGIGLICTIPLGIKAITTHPVVPTVTIAEKVASPDDKTKTGTVTFIERYYATVYIAGDDFRYDGPYLDEVFNISYLDLIQKGNTLYVFNPENKTWLALDAKLKVTDIPLVSESMGLGKNTVVGCEQDDLDKYKDKLCKIPACEIKPAYYGSCGAIDQKCKQQLVNGVVDDSCKLALKKCPDAAPQIYGCTEIAPKCKAQIMNGAPDSSCKSGLKVCQDNCAALEQGCKLEAESGIVSEKCKLAVQKCQVKWTETQCLQPVQKCKVAVEEKALIESCKYFDDPAACKIKLIEKNVVQICPGGRTDKTITCKKVTYTAGFIEVPSNPEKTTIQNLIEIVRQAAEAAKQAKAQSS